jgi:alpha-L-fucosidase 2
MNRRTLLKAVGAGSAARLLPASAETPPGVSRYDVAWNSPSLDSLGSMPLGNGETGLNVWAERNGDLLFYIGRADAFREDHENVKLGRIRVHFDPNPFLKGSPFHQKLELENGRILIDAGTAEAKLHLSIWVDANQPVIRIEGRSAILRAATVAYEMWRPLKTAASLQDPSASGGDIVLDNGADRLVWYHRNATSVWSKRLGEEGLTDLVAGKVKDPLLHHTFGGMIQARGFQRTAPISLGSNTPISSFVISVHLHAGQYAEAAEWGAALEQQADRTDRMPIESAWNKHQNWWHEFWQRSWIHVGGPSITRTISERYAHQRFINACSNRGRYPVMYNGSIFTMDLPAGTPTYFGALPKAENADYRSWGSLPIMWQNTRHPYWPMLSSGDFDLMRPVFELCRDSLEVCKARARVWHGQDGMLMPESMYLAGVSRFGRKIPQHLVYHRTGMVEMANMMGDYVHHTGDRRFAREVWLPFADAVVLFFEQHYPQRDGHGRMVMSPSAAVETYQPALNPVTESAGLARALEQLLALAAEDAPSGRRERWAALREATPGTPERTIMGQRLLAVADEGPAGREICEVPELYAVWPFRRISHTSHRQLAAARQSFAVRMMSLDGTDDKQAYETGGWLYTAADAAYLNLPREAARLVEQNFGDGAPWLTGTGGKPPLPDGHPGQPRFSAFWETRMDFIPDQCHGGASIHALQSMLLQAEGTKILLMPAWPEEWDVRFKLHAPLNTVIEGEYRGGALRVVRVTPERRRADIVDMSAPERRIRTMVGAAISDFNYLFGLSPMVDAEWRPAAAKPWLERYGHTLRGVAGPFAPADWGGSIAHGTAIHVHVLDEGIEDLALPPLPLRMRSCRSLAGPPPS